MALPDYMTDMNAVLKDKVEWLHGTIPDYSKANNLFLKGKCRKKTLNIVIWIFILSFT